MLMYMYTSLWYFLDAKPDRNNADDIAVSLMIPQWGAADAEIKVPSVEYSRA